MNPATLLADLAQVVARSRESGGAAVAPAFRQALGAGLGDVLSPRLAGALDAVLTRLESSALFAEESCSFSQRDLFEALEAWLDHARATLPAPGSHAPRNVISQGETQ